MVSFLNFASLLLLVYVRMHAKLSSPLLVYATFLPLVSLVKLSSGWP